MANLPTGTLAVILVFVVICLFVFSNAQKRKHEDKMRTLRAERKANIEKLKQQQAAKDSPSD